MRDVRDSALTVTVPCSSGFVGYTLAGQGFAFGAGPCLSALRFSDTIDMTIR